MGYIDRRDYGRFYEFQDKERKVAALRAMHGLATSDFPDVCEGAWLAEGVPDDATTEDYWAIADDADEFERVVRLWATLVLDALDYEE